MKKYTTVGVFVVMGVIFAWSTGVGSWVGGTELGSTGCRENESRSGTAPAGQEGPRWAAIHGARWPAGNGGSWLRQGWPPAWGLRKGKILWNF